MFVDGLKKNFIKYSQVNHQANNGKMTIVTGSGVKVVHSGVLS